MRYNTYGYYVEPNSKSLKLCTLVLRLRSKFLVPCTRES